MQGLLCKKQGFTGINSTFNDKDSLKLIYYLLI